MEVGVEVAEKEPPTVPGPAFPKHLPIGKHRPFPQVIDKFTPKNKSLPGCCSELEGPTLSVQFNPDQRVSEVAGVGHAQSLGLRAMK